MVCQSNPAVVDIRLNFYGDLIADFQIDVTGHRFNMNRQVRTVEVHHAGRAAPILFLDRDRGSVAIVERTERKRHAAHLGIDRIPRRIPVEEEAPTFEIGCRRGSGLKLVPVGSPASACRNCESKNEEESKLDCLIHGREFRSAK